MSTPPDLDQAIKQNTLESALSLSDIYCRPWMIVALSSRRHRYPEKFQNLPHLKDLSEDKHSESSSSLGEPLQLPAVVLQ